MLIVQSCLTLATLGLKDARLLCPWNSPGKNVRVGSHSIHRGIFLTKGLNLGLLHCREGNKFQDNDYYKYERDIF